MKVLICGSRDWSDSKLMYKAMHKLQGSKPGSAETVDDIKEFDIVIEGEAQGADQMARIIADLRDIPVVKMPADWCDFGTQNGVGCTKLHLHNGRKAGIVRNQLMIDEQPDEVWAFSDDLTNDKGTASMVRIAKKANALVRHFSHACPTGKVDVGA